MEDKLTQEQPIAQNLPPLAGGQVKQETRRESDVIVIRLNKTHVVIALVAVVFYFGGYLTHSLLAFRQTDGSTDTSSQVQTEVGDTTGVQSGRIVVEVGDDPFLGPADAPLTIVEFSDFQCPFCKRFRDQTIDQILETYDGKVRFVYRDFPLSSIHSAAQKAAEAAECANEQGQFWPMHDQLFANQASWSIAANPLEVFKSYAEELTLNMTKFNECLDTGKFAGEVLDDLDAGISYNVTGTPTFFINGIAVAGAQPFSEFQRIIEAELANSGK